MNARSTADYVRSVWDGDAVDALRDYIRIPNVSPAFDPAWKANGHMDRAVDLIASWMRSRPIEGMRVEVHEIEGLTPLVMAEVPARGGGHGDVLLYGHLDKQPAMVGWRDGLGPWEPVLDGDRLYGRGGGDDGYAAFAALSAIEACQAAGQPHGRCVVLIEASEESASTDLETHIDALGARIGTPELVVCLDSGCATYDRLWLTTSLRGLVSLEVTVRVLTDGVHSGAAGGIVPSTFRILRSLLDRIEDASTGAFLLDELATEVPTDRAAEMQATADALAGDVASFPFAPGVVPLADGDPVAQLRANTWETAMEVIGIAGFPAPADAGNVLRPFTTALLSFRLPPTAPPQAALDAIVGALTEDVPFGAKVTIGRTQVGAGWNAPPTAAWLAEALDRASLEAFGASYRTMGEGGSIPFMAMLGARFPDAQFMVTGVLGPDSNAHGPNEYLHLPTAKAVSVAVAHVLAAHGST